MNLEKIKQHLENIEPFHIQEGIMQRGIGDVLENTIQTILGLHYPVIGASSKRSIEDFEIHEGEDIYKFDVKTHNVNAKFSMPNLISVKRLKKYLGQDTNHLVYVFVDYHLNDSLLTIDKIFVFRVEQLDWSCLHIGNLGKGQLQIKQAGNFTINDSYDRQEWVTTLTHTMKAFYYSLIESVKKEIDML